MNWIARITVLALVASLLTAFGGTSAQARDPRRPATARTAAVASPPAVQPAAGQFVPVAPTTVVAGTALAAAGTTTVTLAGANGIPLASQVSAVAVQIQVDGTGTAGGYAQLYPAGATRGSDSTVNFTTAGYTASYDVVPVSSTGAVTVYCSAACKVFLRLRGYVTSAAATTAGSTYVPLAPTNVIAAQAMAAGATATATIAGAHGVPAANQVEAVALNVLTYRPGAAGIVRSYPTGGAVPSDGTVWATGAGDTRANYEVVRLSVGGQVSFTATAATTLYVRLRGYWLKPTATGAGSRYVPAARATPVDTSLVAGGTTTATLAGANGIPATGVSAVAFNAVASAPSAAGHLMAYPAGTARPGIAFEYYPVGVTTGVHEETGVSSSGQATFYSSAATKLLVRARGYFAKATVPAAPATPTVTASDGQATVSWVRPKDGGAAITGYTITASPGGRTVSVGNDTTGTVTGLDNGVLYTFSVKAVNAVGSSPASPASKAVVPMGGEVLYAHDAKGRVAAAFTSAGAGIDYTYDTDDNLTGIAQRPAGVLAVVQASPPVLEVGGRYEIYGTAFGSNPDAVKVTVGGVPASLLTLRPNHLTVSAPAGTSGGQVTLTVAGQSVAAGTLTVLAPPKVTAVSPAVVDRAGTITITGTGFDAQRSGNSVELGGTRLHVLTASATTLTVTAPGFGVTGPMSVRTRAGLTTSAALVTVPPAPFLAADVVWKSLPVESPTTMTTTSSNQIVLFTVKATAGQRLGFEIAESFSGAYELHVWGPDRAAAIAEETVSSSTEQFDLPRPAKDGYYLVEVDPRDDVVGSVTVTAKQAPDVTRPVSVDGAAVSSTTTVTPSHATFTFTGTKGQLVFTRLGASSGHAGESAVLWGPNGQKLATEDAFASDGYLPGTLLPENGTYTVDVDPLDWRTGTFTAQVTTVPPPVSATTTVDGAAGSLTFAKPGQTGSVSFTGTQGQVVHIDLVPSAATLSSGTVSLRAPDGSLLILERPWSTFRDSLADRYTLPQTGEYLLVLDPAAAQTGALSVSVTVVPADTSTGTTVGAAPKSFGNTRPGQNARLTFPATTGQRVVVTCTAVANGTHDVQFSLLDPSGRSVDGTQYCSTSPTGILFDTRSLTAGTWTVLADPDNSLVLQRSVQVLNVPADAGLSTTVGAAATTLNLATGQNGTMTFPVTAGQRFIIGCTLTTASQQYGVRFTLRSTESSATRSASCYESDAGGLFDTVTPSASGTWTIAVDPSVAASVGVTLRVISVPADRSVTVTAGAAASLPLATGQNATVSFNRSAGQRFILGCTLSDPSKQFDVAYRIVRPDGTVEASPNCYTSDEGMLRDTLTSTAAGTWQVLVDPQNLTALTVGLRLYDVAADVAKTVTIGGAGAVVTTTPGQAATVSFTGSANQKVQVTLSSSSYPACAAYVPLQSSTGTTLTTTCLTSGSAMNATLPAAGTYRVVVDPRYLAAGSVTVAVKVAPAVTPQAAPQRAVIQNAPQDSAAQRQLQTSARSAAAVQRRESGRPAGEQDGASTRGRVSRDAPDGPVYPRQRDSSFTGRILRTDGAPLRGVTITVADRSTRTGADGRFRLSRLPEGSWLMAMDGRTASTRTKQYGYFDVLVGLRKGSNRLFYQPYLPVLDTDSEVRIDGADVARDTVLRTPKVRGLEVHIPKGARITDADGRPVKRLGITPIPVHRTPIPMPKGVQVPVYFTVQPAGGRIEDGDGERHTQIHYPNYLDQNAGAQLNFWTHEKYAEGWEVYGKGAVSPDGTQVIPDADTYVENFDGAMINVSGWAKGLMTGLLDSFGAAGDPVDLATGRFTFSQTDLSVGGAMPIEMQRSYSSGDGWDRPFGMGGVGTYDTFLTSDKQWQEADLNFPDGTRVHFARTSAGTGYSDAIMTARTASPEYAGATLAYNGRGWDLARRDGSVLVYGFVAPLQSIRHRSGASVTIRRVAKNTMGNQIGAIVSVTSSDGAWMTFDYDSDGHVTDVHDNAGRTVSYGYDTANHLTSVTDPVGGLTRYGWTGDNLTSITDARNKVFLTNEYDTNGRVTKQTLADGGTYGFVWTLDATGEKVVSVAVTDPAGAKRVVDYDAAGYLVKDRNAVGTALERGYAVERDPTTHVPVKVTDTDGRVTSSVYNENLQATSTTYSSGGLSRTERATYGGPGGAMDSATDALGHTTRYAFDQAGNVSTVTDPEGRTATMTWNSDGTPASSQVAGGGITRFEYVNGLLATTVDPLGRRTDITVDEVGRPVEVISPDGAVTRTAYDMANRVTSSTDPLGKVTSFAYDPNGNLLKVTDPKLSVSSWTYDDMDRMATATDPLGKVSSVTYTALGRPATTTDRRSLVTEMRYDALQRPTFVGFGRTGSAGAYAYESKQDLAYDARGRLTSVADSAPGAGSVTYGYDGWDRVISEVSTATGGAGTVTRAWDDGDRLVSSQVSGLPAVTYAYDASDAVRSITQGSSSSVLTYDVAGRVATQTVPGGVARTNAYDAAGAVTAISYATAAGKVGDLTYGFDRAGRLARTGGSWARTNLPAPSSGVSVDAGDRLTGADGVSFTYDDEGNLTKRTSAAGSTSYAWDARGQLRSTAGVLGSSAVGYDALGRRTSTTVDGQVWGSRYDGSELVAQDGPAGVAGGDLVFFRGAGTDEVLASVGGSDASGRPDASGGAGGTSGMLTDRLGSVLATTVPGSTTGGLGREYTYGPYGTVTGSPAGVDVNPVRFTGRESGPGVPGGAAGGLQYNRARWYDASISRFISEDPAGMAGSGTNPYAYVGGNPVDATDPSGQYAQVVVGCLVGAGFSAGHTYLTGRKHGASTYVGAALGGCAMGMFQAFAFAKVLHSARNAVRLLEFAQEMRTSAQALQTAANGGNRVFWSGGHSAKEAAADFAKANGAKTLEMTPVGRALERLPYNRFTAKLWDAASAGFAATTRGDANVFIGPSFRGAGSVFGRIEGPILRFKGNPILQRFEDAW